MKVKKYCLENLATAIQFKFLITILYHVELCNKYITAYCIELMGHFMLLDDIHNIVQTQENDSQIIDTNINRNRMTPSSSTSSFSSVGDQKLKKNLKSSINIKKLESVDVGDHKRNNGLYQEKVFFIKNHFSLRNIQKIIEYFLVDEDEHVRKAAILTLIHLHSNNIQLHITLYRQLKKLLKDTNEDVRIAAMNAIW